MSTAVQARPMAAGWLKGETFDLAFILGIPLLAVGVAALGALDAGLFYMLVVADLWLLGYHHVVSTFTKLAGSVEDRRRNRALIWYLLPGMLAGTVALGFAGGVIAIVTLYFFWQWFHYVRQSWGIAQRYRHRAGGLAWDHPRLAEITMWSVPAWGLLHRCHQNPDAFLEMPVYLPPVPGVLVQGVGLASLGLVTWWAVTRWQAWRRGELAAGHTLFVLSHFGIFALAYVAIPDINLGWLAVNVWHNTQYVVFVWLHNRKRFADGVSEEARVLSWLSQPGVSRALIYYGACIAVSTVFYFGLVQAHQLVGSVASLSSLSFLILFGMGINFHHYVVDGIIWKRRREVAPAH